MIKIIINGTKTENTVKCMEPKWRCAIPSKVKTEKFNQKSKQKINIRPLFFIILTDERTNQNLPKAFGWIRQGRRRGHPFRRRERLSVWVSAPWTVRWPQGCSCRKKKPQTSRDRFPWATDFGAFSCTRSTRKVNKWNTFCKILTMSMFATVRNCINKYIFPQSFQISSHYIKHSWWTNKFIKSKKETI